MSLPFLKNQKRHTGLIMDVRKPDGGSEEQSEDYEDQGLKACAADLIRAVHSKDEDGVCEALRAAFEILESEPHEEAGEPNENEGDIE